MKIKNVTTEHVNKFWSDNENSTEGNYTPICKMMVVENNMYVGIDNSTGCAFVEEFKDEHSCMKWLNNKN